MIFATGVRSLVQWFNPAIDVMKGMNDSRKNNIESQTDRRESTQPKLTAQTPLRLSNGIKRSDALLKSSSLKFAPSSGVVDSIRPGTGRPMVQYRREAKCNKFVVPPQTRSFDFDFDFNDAKVDYI